MQIDNILANNLTDILKGTGIIQFKSNHFCITNKHISAEEQSKFEEVAAGRVRRMAAVGAMDKVVVTSRSDKNKTGTVYEAQVIAMTEDDFVNILKRAAIAGFTANIRKDRNGK